MTIGTIIAIVWLHFAADFILQTDRMAQSKSTSNAWLTIHVAVYAVPFLVFGWRYALVNAVCHWLTDFVSSRATSALWKRDERHWFFVVIGADQAIHLSCLLATLELAA